MIATVDLDAADAADQLKAALSTVGFVELVGHGLDPHARAEMRAVCDQFFALDHDLKTEFIHEDPAANRGYRARGSEALSYSLGQESPPDLFESFNASPTQPASPHRLRQSTPWPDSVVPGFSDAVSAVWADFAPLAERLDRIIGELIGAAWLAHRSGQGPDMLANINYRPDADGSEPTVAGQQRMGAHTDYTTFTLLDADAVPGLQIVSPSGEWVDVSPAADGLLMNVGDALAMLTNDGWPSTLHRVVPMSSGSAPHRRSVAFFHYPNLDVELAPLEAFVTRTRPARYDAVTVEDHLLAKLVAPKTHTATTATSTAAGRLQDQQ